MEEIYNEHKHALYMYALKLTETRRLWRTRYIVPYCHKLNKGKIFQFKSYGFACSSVIIVKQMYRPASQAAKVFGYTL